MRSKSCAKTVCLGPLPSALCGALWHGGQCSCTEKALWSNLGQKKGREESQAELGAFGGTWSPGAAGQSFFSDVRGLVESGSRPRGACTGELSQGQLEGMGRSLCATAPAPRGRPVSPGDLVPVLHLGSMQTPDVSGHLHRPEDPRESRGLFSPPPPPPVTPGCQCPAPPAQSPDLFTVG